MEQTTQRSLGRGGLLVAFGVALLLGTASQARAQVFVSPMLGVNFGGVSGCPRMDNCTDKQTTVSVAAGAFGRLVGAEAEIAYAPTFFGEAPGLSSHLVALMGNVMVAPRAGPFRPYMLAGVGLIRTHAKLTIPTAVSSTNNVLGFSVGGGVVGFFTHHVGLRGDIRYFTSPRDFVVQGLTLYSKTLNYSRVSGGVVVAF